MKNYLKDKGFACNDKVLFKCADDDEPVEAIVDRDSNGIYFLSFDGVAYYPTASDFLQAL